MQFIRNLIQCKEKMYYALIKKVEIKNKIARSDFLSNELLATIVGGGIGVVGIVIGALITQRSARIEFRQKEYQAKREALTDVYKSLISIINLYPDESPNDILRWIKYAPGYRLEGFDAIFNILDIKLEDYKNQLGILNIDYQRKSELEIEISNIQYAKEKLITNRDSYYKAVKEYTSFIDSDKRIFDLYAGQNVRNFLVRFEVTISNVFVAGYSVGEPDDPNDNTIKIARRGLINAMRNDIGII
ncbi:hypothetical protein [Listeria booriae]|uniref:hypothetical protein n=1 Tax=Listeria booriae TaxID=1552123 RepID=UPI0021ADE76B|nr:hypothetical protein [Listeria booriae]